MKKEVAAGLIIAALIAIGYAIFALTEKPVISECSSDNDCVPENVCHPKTCVLKPGSPDENPGMICTAVCEPGSLDCGQGSCECINKKCEAVFK